MISQTFSNVHDFLGVPTPSAWIDAALADIDTLLIDHANCEKKAASSALAIMFRYAEDHTLVNRLSKLAREELRHFEQIQKIIRDRGVPLRRLQPGRYADGLRKLMRHHEPARLVDTLIVGAFIEARSCERFAAIAPHLPDDLGSFYNDLYAAEARHFLLYLDFARFYAKDEKELATRIALFAQTEADLITSSDPQFRFHSGVPDKH